MEATQGGLIATPKHEVTTMKHRVPQPPRTRNPTPARPEAPDAPTVAPEPQEAAPAAPGEALPPTAFPPSHDDGPRFEAWAE